MSKSISSAQGPRRKAGQGVARKKPPKRESSPNTGSQGGRHGARTGVGDEERRRRIAVLAYYRAEQRGFGGGSAEQDWLAAEIEIDRTLGSGRKVD